MQILHHIAKGDEINVGWFFPQGIGRMYGFWYEEHLPISEKVTIQLTADQAAAIEQLMKKHLWGESKDDIKFQTLRCFWDGEFIKNLSEIYGHSPVENIYPEYTG